MIWIVGARGMLGSDIYSLLDTQGYECIETDLDVDITDYDAVSSFIEHKKIEWIVNCAAYTAVDDAEENYEAAHALNVRGPKNLARAASEIGARLIHFSTDYVFGDSGYRLPVPEDAEPAPGCIYGKTKLKGEEAVRAEGCSHFIIRIAWLYGRKGKNFVHTMLRLMKERQTLRVVDDQHGCPTWTMDVAHLVSGIIGNNGDKEGTFHFCGKEATTWFGFGKEIRRIAVEFGLLENPAEITPCTSDEFPTKARRPEWSVLSTEKVQRTFGVEVPTWKHSIEQYLIELSRQKRSNR